MSTPQVAPLDGACGGAQVSLSCRIIKGTFWLCHILHSENWSTSNHLVHLQMDTVQWKVLLKFLKEMLKE